MARQMPEECIRGNSTWRGHRPPHLWPLLHLVEPSHNHLALGHLANMLGRVLELFRKEGEPRRALDHVDYTGVNDGRPTKRRTRTWRDKALEGCLVGDDGIR